LKGLEGGGMAGRVLDVGRLLEGDFLTWPLEEHGKILGAGAGLGEPGSGGCQ